MKIAILTLVAAVFATTLIGKDFVTLTNQMIFEGKVLKIDDCEVIFRAHGKRHVIPAADIESIQFGDVNDKIYTGYLSMLQSNPDLCMKGKADAENFHGKGAGHFFLGMLFGPFAIIGTAVSAPSPDRGRKTYMMSQNKEHFSDPSYLSCYRKKAKGKLIGMEAAGWGTFLLLMLLL